LCLSLPSLKFEERDCTAAKAVRKPQSHHQIFLSSCRPQTLHFDPPNPCCRPVLISPTHKRRRRTNEARYDRSSAPRAARSDASRTCRVPNAGERASVESVSGRRTAKAACPSTRSPQARRMSQQRGHNRTGANPASRTASVNVRLGVSEIQCHRCMSYALQYASLSLLSQISVRLQRARGWPLARMHACAPSRSVCAACHGFCRPQQRGKWEMPWVGSWRWRLRIAIVSRRRTGIVSGDQQNEPRRSGAAGFLQCGRTWTRAGTQTEAA
jgi:hypothetical protein